MTTTYIIELPTSNSCYPCAYVKDTRDETEWRTFHKEEAKRWKTALGARRWLRIRPTVAGKIVAEVNDATGGEETYILFVTRHEDGVIRPSRRKIVGAVELLKAVREAANDPKCEEINAHLIEPDGRTDTPVLSMMRINSAWSFCAP